MHIDRWDENVDEYNNAYHRPIKMELIDVKLSTYVHFGVEYNDRDPKFKVRDHVRILKYKNIFAKGCTPNWSEETFVNKKS